MRVTIKGEKIEPVITVKDVKPGYVFEILDSGSKYNGYVKALKLQEREFVLLQYSSGNDWFELCDKISWIGSPVKILGKLTEIVVDPNV